MSGALRKLRYKYDGIHKMVELKENDLELLKVLSHIYLNVHRKELTKLLKKSTVSKMTLGALKRKLKITKEFSRL